MNNSAFAPRAGGHFWAAFILLLTPLLLYQASAANPAISAVRLDGKNVLVSVSVPAGVKKVTLESRSRLDSGAWVPRSVSRLDGQGGDISFNLPKSAQAEILRVRADASEPLPASFYKGTNTFEAGAATGVLNRDLAPVANAAGAGGTTGSSSTDTSRAVVESDIWNVSGNTLYCFNQYRGLQVIDVSAPDSPVITGTFPLPAAGEQMYVLSGKYVVLLAQDNCSSANGSSQFLVLDVSTGQPNLVASLPISGWIQESRMVGTALYVASQAYQPVTSNKDGSWQWGSTVSSFDLSTPAKPIAKDTLWYSGYGNVINATDQFLFIAIQNETNWWQSILKCIDISAPDGGMKALSSINLSGRVPDKFKINQNADVLSVISENWNTGNTGVFTSLETFSLADPTAPQKLGRLQFPQREQLHATRFDGNRVYIVTFYQMDPLWIVDLSDPTAPHIAGELHVPGWSTYIEPLGDRLVAIGISNTNDWRVAVSLFDVHDPTQPALLSKVPLGVNNSWSEANNDEKAFSVQPDSGLILVPYQGYETNGYASRVQLIDLASDSLTARGTIEHAFQPRRATLHNNRIYSISGKELLAVDASDRDNPAIRADLELSWSVDRVYLSGDYILEIANGNNWYGWWSQSAATPPSVRVIKQSDPDHPLSTLLLANAFPVLGGTVQDGKLFLVQGASGNGLLVLDANGNPTDPQPKVPTLYLSVLDLSQLPTVSVIGQSQAVTDPLGWNASLQPVWPKPGLLVWSGGGNSGILFFARGITPVSLVSGGVASDVLLRPWYGGNGGGRLFAFDVKTPSSPGFLSDVNLTTNNWWSFSSSFTANGLVFVSHQTSDFQEGVILPGQTPPAPETTVDPVTGVIVTNVPPIGVWVQRYYMDVVDYADPKAPTLRAPVNIPGQLNGLSLGGDLLYTVAPHWTNWVSDWTDWLDASAYDGVSASLVASQHLPTDWPHPLLIADSTIFLGRPDTANNVGQLETWTLTDGGKFGQTGTLKLSSAASTLGLFGKLLAAQLNDSTTLLVDPSNPSALAPIGKGQPQDCLYFDLTRADGSIDKGLWLPLGDYGLSSIPIDQKKP